MDDESESVFTKEFLFISGLWIQKAIISVADSKLRCLMIDVKIRQSWDKCPSSKLELHCPSRAIVDRLWNLAEEIALALYRLRSWFGAIQLPHFVICYEGKPVTPIVNPMSFISDFNELVNNDWYRRFSMNPIAANFDNSNLLDLNGVMGSFLLGFNGLINDGWKRIIDEIYEEQRPCFLVSLDFHRNILFNQAAVELLNSTPEKLLTKSLPKLWVPPSEIKPVEYDLKVPQNLVDFNSLLRQQSMLRSHHFQNWKEDAVAGTAEWVEWTDNISYHELPNGGNARKMVVLGWEPVPALVPKS